ncbi:MAG: flavodoxin family protein [Desulfovibrionaceae bacterium]|nr:flavodoxin family protein [Desulfovibrionaceae bacterium]
MSDEPHSTEKRFSRRKALSWAGFTALAAALGGFLYKHISSTSSVHVESFSTSGNGQKKNILVMTGSGRTNGNSNLLANAFVTGAKEAGHTVNIFHTAMTPVHGCMHCEACWSTGKPCVIDDAFDQLFPLLEKADMLVFCSPLYWYNFSGQIKCAIDRMYPYSKKKRLRSMNVRETMLLMCAQSHFLRSFAGPAEAYRQMLGYKHWTDRGRLFVTGVDDLGDIVGHDALAKAEDMGRNA